MDEPLPQINEDTGKLELDHPSPWGYKVIGADERISRRAVHEIIGDAEASIEAHG